MEKIVLNMGLLLPLKFLSRDKNITEGFKIFTHDSSYVFIDSSKKDIFGISTERITRIKHDPGSILQFFEGIRSAPSCSLHHSFLYKSYHKSLYNSRFFEFYNSEKIRHLLKIGKLSKNKLSHINYFFRLFRTPFFLFNLIFQRFFHVFSLLIKQKISWHKHHLCHAVPSYFFSPFFGKKSLIFVLDGLGEDEYSSLWIGDSKSIEMLSESKTVRFNSGNFSSIGFLYNLFTETLGFQMDSDEGKVEALAAYGMPDAEFYGLCKSAYIINEHDLKWEYDMEIVQKIHNRNYLKQLLLRIGRENFAATVQKFLEDTVVDYLNVVHRKYPIERLCLSGGVTANVIMNLHIYERTPFKNIYIFPAMGDDGTAFGPAIIEASKRGNDLSWLHKEVMPYWGPSYTRMEVLTELNKWSDRVFWSDENPVWPEIAAQNVSAGKIIAIFQGKMEFGPRALGNRSIIADPRDQKIREKMNLSIKRRPYFQPFCPSILESERKRLFMNSYPNKHMTMAFRFKDEIRKILPSACHIDGTARPQFVEESDNVNYYRLLLEMKRLTGYGVVVNTSFNLHGRAMVMSPKQAIQDFLDCNLDVLFIEGFQVLRK